MMKLLFPASRVTAASVALLVAIFPPLTVALKLAQFTAHFTAEIPAVDPFWST